MKKKKGKTYTQEKGEGFLFRESFKILRTNLDFIASCRKCQVVLITSALPNDGKSTVSLNLAAALGEAGKKVLLADCDLRKGSLGKMLEIYRQKDGITTLLSGKTSWDNHSLLVKKQQFTFLSAGPAAPNPTELLASEQMEQLIQKLAGEYDYVILDTPPVCYMADAIAVGKYTDGAILVVRHKGTQVQALKKAMSDLDTAGIQVLGTVLNQYDVQRAGSYGDGYYGYYGRYGYSSYAEEQN